MFRLLSQREYEDESMVLAQLTAPSSNVIDEIKACELRLYWMIVKCQEDHARQSRQIKKSLRTNEVLSRKSRRASPTANRDQACRCQRLLMKNTKKDKLIEAMSEKAVGLIKVKESPERRSVNRTMGEPLSQRYIPPPELYGLGLGMSEVDKQKIN